MKTLPEEIRKIILQIIVYDAGSTADDIIKDIDDKFNDVDIDLWYTKIISDQPISEEQARKETNDSDVFYGIGEEK